MNMQIHTGSLIQNSVTLPPQTREVFRPLALRPILSDGLPLSFRTTLIRLFVYFVLSISPPCKIIFHHRPWASTCPMIKNRLVKKGRKIEERKYVEGSFLLIFGNPAALDSKVFRPLALRPILSNGLPLSFKDIICVNVKRLSFKALKYHHLPIYKISSSILGQGTYKTFKNKGNKPILGS